MDHAATGAPEHTTDKVSPGTLHPHEHGIKVISKTRRGTEYGEGDDNGIVKGIAGQSSFLSRVRELGFGNKWESKNSSRYQDNYERTIH
jgi:hypothetical protein